MENGKLWDLLNERVATLEERVVNNQDKLTRKIERVLEMQQTICGIQDKVAQTNTKDIAVLHDRQKRIDKRNKTWLTIIGMGVTILNVIIQKLKIW